ncbi:MULTISPECIES: GntR family transcriptional regulator [Tsukamurella]|uniref:GntR family transcriptional regulator n=1 Tax=Tsukamurella TaxID=2060 RepID=UPI00195FAB94|nr:MULTISPECIES: GntR family transcriptional regulator [Tsukamurella]
MSTGRQRGHAATDATDDLRRAIVEGVLRPGDPLREERLAAELGVSRNTLREAMRTLAHEGLIAHEANRGARVTTPTRASVRDIYLVRRTVEPPSLRAAGPDHPAAVRMRDAVDAARAAARLGDWQAVGTADLEFHRAIVGLNDSPRLDAVLDSILAELRLAFGAFADPEFLHAPFLDDNVVILETFESGRGDEAAALLVEYLLRSERTLFDSPASRPATAR